MANQGNIGKVLDGRYRIRERIGAGGMATAYLAWDERLECEVVVKIPHPNLLDDENFRTRFTREIRRLVQFRHAHVVGVIDADLTADLPFLVMEYLSGGSLEDRLAGGPQDLDTVRAWLAPISAALDFMHGEGFVHRDVKPGNILFDRSGNVHLADFGLAKTLSAEETTLTATGATPGSLAYMPPEAFSGEASPAADQYSLGATVLHSLTGEIPRPLEASMVAREQLTTALSAGSLGVLQKALSRDPEQRHSCCAAFAEALSRDAPEPEVIPVPEVDPPEPAAPVLVAPGLDERLVMAWIESIRSAASSNGIREKTAFHRIPWYALIGASDAGKSTLLTESGLDLRIAESGEHDLKSRWWVGKRGIFFETGASDPEAAEWQAFKEVFEKQRGGRKLDGAIVALSAQALLERTEEALEKEVGDLRRLLGDLIGLSSRAFPVFVVVTQCDRIAGFAEFIEALPEETRGACLGWAPAAGSGKYDAEAFAAGMNRLVEGLFRVRPRCLADTSILDQGPVFLLPEEIRHVVPPLERAMAGLFRPDHKTTPPVPGGVYFAGKPGEGRVLAPALDEISEKFGLPSRDTDPGRSMGVSSGLFHRELLARAILPAGGGATRGRTPALKTVLSAVVLLIAIVGGVVVVDSYLGSAKELDEIERALPGEGTALDLAHAFARMAKDAAPDRLRLQNEVKHLCQHLEARSASLVAECLLLGFDECAEELKRGIPETPRGERDLLAYLDTCEEFQLLEEWISGRDVGPVDADVTDRLAHRLRVRGTMEFLANAELLVLVADLRAAPGALAEHSRTRRSPEVEAAMLGHLASPLEDIAGFAELSVGRQGMWLAVLDEGAARAVEQLRRFGSLETGHGNPEDVLGMIKPFLSLGMGPMFEIPGPPRPLGIAGIEGVQDIPAVLQRIVGVLARIPDPGKASLTDRLDSTRELLDTAFSDERGRELEDALDAIWRHCRSLLDLELEGPEYDRPDETELASARTEIEGMIGDAEKLARSELSGPLETIGGEDPEEGWPDVLILLLRARYGDLLKQSYFERGLEPLLEGDAFWRLRASDPEAEIYTVRRLEEKILPALREQATFLSDPLLADSIRKSARSALVQNLEDFLQEVETYWFRAFQHALPHEAPNSLPEIYEQLDLLTEPRSELLRTLAEIEAALSGATDLEGPDDDPLLEATMPLRRRLFETFVICFDPKVRNHMTLAEAGKSIQSLKRVIEPLTAGLGTPSGKAARDLLARQLAGSGPEFRRVHEDVRDLRREAANSKPAGMLADVLDAILDNAWDELARLAADDLNETWAMVSADWRMRAEDGSPQVFAGIFGTKTSEFEAFLANNLDPFFVGPDRLPIETSGADLLIRNEFRAFLGNRSEILSLLRPDGAGFKADRIRIDLSVAGNNVTGMTAEYSAGDKTSASDEKRTDEVPVGFDFVWSPDDCRSLVFRVSMRDGSTRKLEWTGPWAVAAAFAEARREGNRYTWQRRDGEIGSYAVSVELAGESKLLTQLMVFGGRSPTEALLARLPEKIVELRK